MLMIAGCATVVFCVFGGYVLNNGHLGVLWQPLEFLVILGAGGKGRGHLMKGPHYGKEHYLELPTPLFQMFKIAKTESYYFKCIRSGLLALLGGDAPAISIEYARKSLPTELRPGFTEVEEATAAPTPV